MTIGDLQGYFTYCTFLSNLGNRSYRRLGNHT